MLVCLFGRKLTSLYLAGSIFIPFSRIPFFPNFPASSSEKHTRRNLIHDANILQYISWQWLHSCVFPCQSVDRFFFIWGRGKTLVTMERRELSFFYNRISCVASFGLAFVHDYYFYYVLYVDVLFFIQFRLPLFSNCHKKVIRQSLLILMCAWKVHFLNVKGMPRWKWRRSPPPPFSPRKLFVVFIVYKMRARLVYTLYTLKRAIVQLK